MSMRGFFRALFKPKPDRPTQPHRGDELAEEIRETMGPLASGPGAAGGRMTGRSVYRHLEDRDRS